MRLKRRLVLTRTYAILATAAVVVLALLFIRADARVGRINLDASTLASELNRTQAELQQTKQLVAAQEVELSALVKQRIPGVTVLELDKLYDVGQRWFRKISFSESGVGDDKRLAYYAVVKSSETEAVVPAATILLFDRKGLQTGVGRITHGAATPAADLPELQPGETRTYSAEIESFRKDPPRFFMIELR